MDSSTAPPGTAPRGKKHRQLGRTVGRRLLLAVCAETDGMKPKAKAAFERWYEEQQEQQEQPLIIMFHNLKGFDGVFILKELYRDSRRVENQACMGAKVLSFKDSLCFLPFPLAAFPSTFGIKETSLTRATRSNLEPRRRRRRWGKPSKEDSRKDWKMASNNGLIFKKRRLTRH